MRVRGRRYFYISGILLVGLFFQQCHETPHANWQAPTLMPVCTSAVSEATAAERRKIFDSPFIHSIQQSLKNYFAHRVDSNAWNGSMLVAYKGVPIFEATHGFANIPGKIPLDSNTVFNLASVSKTLTAAGVLLLYQYGLIHLDDAVKHYIPDFPYPAITINNLLTHRSGLPDYMILADSLWPRNKLMTNADMLTMFSTHKPELLYKPDTRFHYCNTNYALLACIIERVSHLTFAQYMKTYVFAPLGMKHTYIWTPVTAKHINTTDPADTTMPANQAISHDAYGRPEQEIPDDGVVGDKNTYSTAHDLLRWDRALYASAFLRDSIKNLMFNGYSHEHKGVKNYGLGWRMYEYPSGKKVIYHNGWWRGFNTVFYRFPDDKLTLVILNNRYNNSVYAIQPLYDVLHISTAKATDDDWLTLD